MTTASTRSASACCWPTSDTRRPDWRSTSAAGQSPAAASSARQLAARGPTGCAASVATAARVAATARRSVAAAVSTSRRQRRLVAVAVREAVRKTSTTKRPAPVTRRHPAPRRPSVDPLCTSLSARPASPQCRPPSNINSKSSPPSSGQQRTSDCLPKRQLKPNSITLASSELAPNMFGASSELAPNQL